MRWRAEDPIPEAPEGPHGEALYESNIPADAVEHSRRWDATGTEQSVQFVVDGQVVGIRAYDEAGALSSERPYRDGRKHGVCYEWFEPGWLISAEPYRNGMPHGRAKQWSKEGKLLGSYVMVLGTGWDLWWHEEADGTAVLAEARALMGGQRHGFEWWFNEDGSLFEESHFLEGRRHGIERQWNARGRLRRGFPAYYVHDLRVGKRDYLRALLGDSSLPALMWEENQPVRAAYPSPVQDHRRR